MTQFVYVLHQQYAVLSDTSIGVMTQAVYILHQQSTAFCRRLGSLNGFFRVGRTMYIGLQTPALGSQHSLCSCWVNIVHQVVHAGMDLHDT